MRILVTGGAGYIGYSLVNALNNMEEVSSITVYDNLYKKNFNFFMIGEKLDKVSFVNDDILNEYALSKACRNKDIIFHLAAFVDNPFSYQDNFKYEQINQFGTGLLYNILKENPPKKLIFTSSSLVYNFDVSTNEDANPSPDNGYGISKLEGEKYMRLLADSCEVYTPRIANVFGYNPMCRYESVINLFIINALLYKKIQIMGSGEQYRPFIHISHVTSFLKGLVTNTDAYSTKNIVQKSINMNDILSILIKLQPELEYIYVNANQNFKSYVIDSKYYNTITSLEQDIINTYKDFKQHLTI